MRLLEPFALSSLTLPNRVVMAPLTRRRASTGKLATPLMAHHYAQRAGAGLIISEMIEVDPLGSPATPTRPALCNLAQTRSWREVVSRVHASGGRIFAQLSHPGRLSHPAVRGGHLPIAPSALAAADTIATPEGIQPMPVPRALTLEEIPDVVASFADAAAYALAAGFDGVELHAATGFLIDQFLCPETNHRRDAYGGTTARRTRFLLEVVEAVAEVWGIARIGVRLSPRGICNGLVAGTPPATVAYAAAALDEIGIAYLHVFEPCGHQRSSLAQARRHFGGAVIAAGGYGRDQAEAAIDTGLADCVAFGKSFIANPDLPERFRRGVPLTPADVATFYAGGAHGYTDYPLLST